jgi:phage shock protein A
MPGVSGRFSTIVKAKVSTVLDRAEDPAETLDYSYEKQIELLQNVKKGIAEVVTSKKRLQMQEDGFRAQTTKLDGQARQALAAGNEELARAESVADRESSLSASERVAAENHDTHG